MIAIALLLETLLAPARGDEAPAPETRVEISVYDLVGKPRIHIPPAGPRLPKDYGERVAAAVRAAAPALRACLENEPGASAERSVVAHLQIAPKGNAEASFNPSAGATPSATDDCLARTLAAISFPPHPLHEPVKVALPLHLMKKERVAGGGSP